MIFGFYLLALSFIHDYIVTFPKNKAKKRKKYQHGGEKVSDFQINMRLDLNLTKTEIDIHSTEMRTDTRLIELRLNANLLELRKKIIK